jgi:hypothetical protein
LTCACEDFHLENTRVFSQNSDLQPGVDGITRSQSGIRFGLAAISCLPLPERFQRVLSLPILAAFDIVVVDSER